MLCIYVRILCTCTDGVHTMYIYVHMLQRARINIETAVATEDERKCM